MTRTSVFLSPTCRLRRTPAVSTRGVLPPISSCWSCSEQAVARGLGAKLHATGGPHRTPGADAVATIRARTATGPSSTSPPRVRPPRPTWPGSRARVVADASPGLWFPNPMNAASPRSAAALSGRIWPLRSCTTPGSDRRRQRLPAPCPPRPLAEHRNHGDPAPDPSFPGELGRPDQALGYPPRCGRTPSNPRAPWGSRRRPACCAPACPPTHRPGPESVRDPRAPAHQTRVLRTWFAGNPVFQADSADPGLAQSRGPGGWLSPPGPGCSTRGRATGRRSGPARRPSVRPDRLPRSSWARARRYFTEFLCMVSCRRGGVVAAGGQERQQRLAQPRKRRVVGRQRPRTVRTSARVCFQVGGQQRRPRHAGLRVRGHPGPSGAAPVPPGAPATPAGAFPGTRRCRPPRAEGDPGRGRCSPAACPRPTASAVG